MSPILTLCLPTEKEALILKITSSSNLNQNLLSTLRDDKTFISIKLKPVKIPYPKGRAADRNDGDVFRP